MSRQAAHDRAVHARLFAGLLGEAGTATPAEVAGRAGVSTHAAADALAALARDGLVQPAPGGCYRACRLDAREVRELYPAVLLLEALAVRHAPAFSEAVLDELRAANAQLHDAQDPESACQADDEFHRRLTADCGNERLLRVVHPIRRALLPYERVYFATAEHRARSAGQHDAIIEALAGGDHAGAANLVRANFTTALPELTAELDARHRPDEES
jgi:DNA-binding GntR family transcriptional regulator